MLLLLVRISVSQLPAQTVDPGAFERELAAVTDPAALSRVAQERVATTSSASAGAPIALGLVHLRWWELTRNRKEADRAKDEFSKARAIEADNAWAVFGYGLSLAHGPDVRSDGPALAATGRSWARELGLDARSRARRAMEQALALDAGFNRAAEVLGSWRCSRAARTSSRERRTRCW